MFVRGNMWERLNYAPEGLSGGEGDADEGESLNPQEGGAGGDDAPASRFANAGLGKYGADEDEEEGGEDKGDAKQEGGDERPKWLPEKFKTPEAMARAYADLETKLRNSGRANPDDIVPETPDEYFNDGIELDPEVDRLGLEPDDPGLKVAADVFKKYGIGKQTAQAIVKDMFKGMNEHAPLPVDPEQELQALGPNGRHVVKGTMLWLEKLDREGKLSDEDADTAIQLMGTARGVKFLNKLRGMTGERSIPTGIHVADSGGMSPEEWHVAYQKAVAEKDYKKQEELDSISSSVFGKGASSGSPIRGIPGT